MTKKKKKKKEHVFSYDLNSSKKIDFDHFTSLVQNLSL